jgi:3D (Asp-Asp-Asp) domain-containing protein
VVNYATRAGHEIRYKFVKDAPYGIGVDNYKLIPYRTIAVDPAQILIGSIVFIPQAYGLVLPNGEIHDGFFFAHDTGSKIKGRCLDLFVGFEHHVKNTLTRYGRIPNQSEVEVYTVSEPIAGALNQRYRRAYQRMPAQKLFEMNSAEIDSLLRTTLATYPDFVQRLSIYSEKAKGTPYKLSPLGEGPNGKYDRDPLVNFSRADCVTFCEQMLAMSISGSYAEMLQHLQRLRYRNGTVDFRARNHFMMADWLPNNAWLIEDVTKLVGGHLTARMTKTIDRAAFLRKMGVRDASVAAIPPQTMTIDYIPKENLSAIKSKLQGGEMVCIVQNQPGIFIAHTGFIIRDRFGNVLFRHASPRFDARQVIDEFFDDVVKQLGRDPNRAGMVLLRARPQFFN